MNLVRKKKGILVGQYIRSHEKLEYVNILDLSNQTVITFSPEPEVGQAIDKWTMWHGPWSPR